MRIVRPVRSRPARMWHCDSKGKSHGPARPAGRPGSLAAGPRAQQAPRERVAQLVEHLTFNQRVPGSSPGALTIKINSLWLF